MKTEDIRAMALALEAVKGKKLDPVGKHDKDIDNDKDVDGTDKYLIKRRNTVSKAIGKKDVETHVQEEVEELDEISKKLAKSYLDKTDKNEILPYHKFKSRIVGKMRADAKLKGRKDDGEVKYGRNKNRKMHVKVVAAESVEDLGEVNKLGASLRNANKGTVRFHGPTGWYHVHDKDGKKVKTGIKDMSHAVATKWAKENLKEGVEELDELSQGTLQSYHSKAQTQLSDITKKKREHSTARTDAIRKGKDPAKIRKPAPTAAENDTFRKRDKGAATALKKIVKKRFGESTEIVESSYTIHHHKSGAEVAKFDLQPGTKNDAVKKAGEGKFFVKNANGQVVAAYIHNGEKGEQRPHQPYMKFNDAKPKKESFVDRYIDKVVTEELEMFTELSKKTLTSYLDKTDPDTPNSKVATFTKRKLALSKLAPKKPSVVSKLKKSIARFTKEEVERIEELSKATLRGYAHGSFRQANTLLKHSLSDQPKSVEKASAAALARRKKGIKMAGKKLGKDEMEKVHKAAQYENTQGLDEGYKENQDRWVDQVAAVASEIESMAKNLVAAHEAACAAQERVQSTYAKGEKPSEADLKAMNQKLYDVKYLARQLEDVRDALENKHPSAPVEAVNVAPRRYYESVSPTKEEPISIRDALAMMENRALQTAGAAPAQQFADNLSGGERAFMDVHKVQTPDESNIDAALEKNKDEVSKSLQRTVNYRHNDQKTGDK